MNKLKIFLLLLLFTIYCLLITNTIYAKKPRKPKAPPEPKGILPEKDTFVNSSYPNSNFGEQEKITTGFTSSSKVIFIKFDLSKLGQIKENEEIVLNFWLDKSYGKLKSIETEILLPNSDWDEQELTWNNKPSLYPSGISVVLEATPGAHILNLTPLVKQWLNRSIKNKGFALYYNLESFERSFLSKESEENKPRLELKAKSLKLKTENNPSSPESPIPVQLSKAKVKGIKTRKTINDYLGQKSILPIVGLWTASIFGLLIKVFSEFGL